MKKTIKKEFNDNKIDQNTDINTIAENSEVEYEANNKHEDHKSHDPLKQFEIKEVIPIKFNNINISFTNSALYMLISTVLIIIFMLSATRKKLLIPSKIQIIAESFYKFIEDLIKGSIGDEGLKFFPLIFSLFNFILFCNILGMTPYSFTSTSQIVITFSLAIIAFLTITIFAIVRNGFGGFIHMFLPSGVPLFMAPIIFIIELISFLIRPLTLSVRLFANMVAGHVLLKVIAGFIISLGVIFGTLPFLFSIVMTGFELFVAILQAYIFSVLVCAYISETTKSH
jgi:F-type H+-transporting ATPase subunit a